MTPELFDLSKTRFTNFVNRTLHFTIRNWKLKHYISHLFNLINQPTNFIASSLLHTSKSHTQPTNQPTNKIKIEKRGDHPFQCLVQPAFFFFRCYEKYKILRLSFQRLFIIVKPVSYFSISVIKLKIMNSLNGTVADFDGRYLKYLTHKYWVTYW